MNLLQSIYQLDSRCDWEGQALSLRDGWCAPLFVGSGKTCLVQVISSEPVPRTVPVEASSTDSLHAAPLEGIDRSLP